MLRVSAAQTLPSRASPSVASFDHQQSAHFHPSLTTYLHWQVGCLLGLIRSETDYLSTLVPDFRWRQAWKAVRRACAGFPWPEAFSSHPWQEVLRRDPSCPTSTYRVSALVCPGQFWRRDREGSRLKKRVEEYIARRGCSRVTIHLMYSCRALTNKSLGTCSTAFPAQKVQNYSHLSGL